ncbi:SDR family NAD(P)-dependent oxidoreductase [Halomonas sp. V046]|uniref:SDR family NAD(P)-dependent oxidoreductase n=1 Tax=Halomonas sp. V046 TaxID=3459611 RepID=UPI00404413A9
MPKPLPHAYTALVTGANGGIGRALIAALLDDARLGTLIAVSRHPMDRSDTRLESVTADVTTDMGLATLQQAIAGHPLHLVINAIGMLHDSARGIGPEKRLEQLDAEAMARLYHVNAVTPALLLKCLTDSLKGHHPAYIISLSARVGSIADNRLGGWYGYRASKAAHNMVMKTAAIELRRLNRQCCVLCFHPGTTNTELSEPFHAGVPAGKLFSPDVVAARLLALIGKHGPEDSGRFLDWRDTPIDW